MKPHLEIKALSLRIGGQLLFANLSFSVLERERWGLLGKNGTGKTSLLHSIVGLRALETGSILVDGKNSKELTQQELATKLGILFQEGIDTLPATVLETAMLGRHPHVQSMLRDDPADIAITMAALRDMGLERYTERLVDTLSGGERQRLALAMLIAQTPQLFLLDEPNNHLDVAFQVRFFTVLKKKLEQQSASLLMATHDINLAARFCDKIILLDGDGEFMLGSREVVMTEENLSKAYDCSIRSISDANRVLFYPS